MKLALRIDVNTRRGAKEGVPRIVELLNRHQARATFFLALGPDRPFGRGWLPGGAIGSACTALFHALRDAGFEVAIQAYDPVRWALRIADADAEWTARQIESAAAAFLGMFGTPAQAHAATGWRTNRHAWRLTQRLGLRYASDTRGSCPYIPVRNAEIIVCPQLPTTLPTLDELASFEGVTAEAAVAQLLERTRATNGAHLVYAACAHREGIACPALFDRMLAGWRAQVYALCALEDCMEDINIARLPRHSVVEGNVPGRRHAVALQGAEFLA